MIPAMPPANAHDAAPDGAVADRLVAAARTLSEACESLRFAPPVAHVYNPLTYAWAPYERYLRRFGAGRKRAVFLGMNPGPFGMMQTGIPFGEVAAVRDWIGIEDEVRAPALQHPKRPIEGFACRRSEVSGRRLWGWAAARFGSAESFFGQCLVLNWCPLVFLEASGRNRTPEQLPAAELAPLLAACDAHLREAIAALEPEWAIGIGGFARKRLETALSGMAAPPSIGQVLHPSPASPAANRGWAQAADQALEELGVFG
jgi:single-strand selective monofunctional uracil DNA glycosylase